MVSTTLETVIQISQQTFSPTTHDVGFSSYSDAQGNLQSLAEIALTFHIDSHTVAVARESVSAVG